MLVNYLYFQVVGGENAAVKVEGWISRAYVDRLRVEVISLI